MNFIAKAIHNASITKNMICVAFVPIVMTVVLSISLVIPRINQASNYGTLANSTELTTVLSSLLHEQQKERGATAVFLGAGGERFGRELQSQRLETDARFDALMVQLPQYLEQVRDRQDHARIVAKLEGIQKTLGEMADLRAQVDRLDIKTAEAIAYYTGLNGQFLSAIKDISQLSDNGEITSAIIAFANFLNAKERAGVERAVGAGAFSSGSFDMPTIVRFEQLINTQNVYYSMFLADASEAAAQAYAAVEVSGPAQEVQRMRDVVRETGVAGDLQGITGVAFFNAQTKKINLLKGVEDFIATNLLVLMNERRKEARTAAFVSIAASLAAVLLSLGMTLAISRLVSRNMIAVAHAATKMSGGDLEVAVPQATKSEIGQIAGALDYFRQSIVDGQTREAELREKEQTEEARKRALELEEQRAEREKNEAERRQLDEQRVKEQKITSEIATVVSACASGDFGQRLDMTGKEGVFADLCKGINQIAEVTEANIADVVASIGKLAQGNLGIRIDGERQGAFREMQNDFNTALTSLSQTMAQIMQSGVAVSSTSSELETSALGMAKRAETNAAALEETSAAVEQITASIHQVVANAKAAEDATQRVRESADKNRTISDDTEISISAMTEASAQINRVVKVIEDISFQINLLALNAGVEAARAGEAGRGFSVVASEVRALAHRSQEAVQEISAVIAQNNQSVEAGVEKVEQSRKALEGIISDVEVASAQISDIATAVEQQSMGIGEVNSALRSIDSMSQTNAAALEEMTASSVSLSEESKALGDALNHFHGVSEGEAAVENTKVVPLIGNPPATLPPIKRAITSGR